MCVDLIVNFNILVNVFSILIVPVHSTGTYTHHIFDI